MLILPCQYFRQPSLKLVRSFTSYHRAYQSVHPITDDSKVAATPILEYERLVRIGTLRNDENQKTILKSLSHLHEHLQSYTPPNVDMPPIITNNASSFNFSKMFSFGKKRKSKEAIDCTEEDFQKIPQGLYLWGDVGCGKTMLMDLFYSTIPPHLTRKRIHFHQFMQNLHKRSHQIILQHGKQDIDPIPILAAEIAQSATVLCFDEFQVTDVADAMLLRRLLMAVLAPSHGLILFATSNREPNDLYINGIQRESFIPAIRLLEKRTNVIYLNSPIDYRRIPKPISSVYYCPQQNNPFNKDYFSPEIEREKAFHIHEWFKYFSQQIHNTADGTASDDVVTNDKIKVWGRYLVIPKSIPGKIAMFTFEELCGRPLAAGDYLALATHYPAFIVTDIPYLSTNVRDKVRRFITFLDAAYDNHCRLATTAANSFNGLFVDQKLINVNNHFNLVDNAQSQIQDYNKIKGGSAINNSSLNKKSTEELDNSDIDKKILDKSNEMFSLDEEKFAFVRALSRLTQMSTTDWVNFER
ncbi:Afg1 protein [Saccharomycopsis crataegensis]|uniref:Afg1 protein n=1 Tax=Saccharomycopsis crataegensis TaxID=43959 RepID=A0AAV5QMR9_9ASCO|nr:Afg1 protein [Saccharomycopsis crataegensis]